MLAHCTIIFVLLRILLIFQKLEDTIQIMSNTNIESNIIRAVWSSVEAINKNTLLQLNDTDLIYQVMKQIDNAAILTGEDRQSLINYIKARVLLIRDIADSQI